MKLSQQVKKLCESVSLDKADLELVQELRRKYSITIFNPEKDKRMKSVRKLHQLGVVTVDRRKYSSDMFVNLANEWRSKMPADYKTPEEIRTEKMTTKMTRAKLKALMTKYLEIDDKMWTLEQEKENPDSDRSDSELESEIKELNEKLPDVNLIYAQLKLHGYDITEDGFDDYEKSAQVFKDFKLPFDVETKAYLFGNGWA